MKQHTIVILSLLAAFAIIAIITPYGTENTKASSPHNITGWAWSDNTGWLSFSCENDNSCSTVDYGVDVASDGKLSGYAWSDNIGWVSFNQSDLSGCSQSPCSAGLDAGSGVLEGWARALSADGKGWDGFISLSGADPDYGPTLNNSNPSNRIFEGYAWGDDVAGWLKFDSYPNYEVKLSVPICNQNNICEAGLGEDIASCSADCIVEYFSLQKSGDVSITTVSDVGASSNETTISATPTGGFSGDISLSVDSIVPAISGVAYTFGDSTLSESEYGNGSSFSVSVPGGTSAGVYTVKVSGTDGSFISTVDVVLTIAGIEPNFEEF